MDVSTNLQLGKFFGKNSKLQVPFYYQYSQTVRNPKYDALDLDLLLKEKLNGIQNQQVRDSVKEISQDFSSLRQISFTNVRKEASGNGPNFPWNISNFSVSYSNSRAFIRNEIVEKDRLDQNRASLDYTYGLNIKPIQPFKNLSKSNWLKWLTEINLNPFPNSFTFGTTLDRKFGERSYRFSDPIYKTWFDKRFTWDRTYALRWDLTKSIKFTFNAANAAVIDEPDEYISRPQLIRRSRAEVNDSIWQNLQKFGRTKDYTHQLRATYNLPFKNFPFLDWIRTDLSYDANYGWKAASINTDSLGNVINNGQTRSISGELDFTKLYNKSKFLSKINKPATTSTSSSPKTAPKPATPADPKGGTKEPKPSTKQSKQDSKIAKKNAKLDAKNNKERPKETASDTTTLAETKELTKEERKAEKKAKRLAKKEAKKQQKTADDKKKATTVSPVLKTVIRPIMSIRKFRINYGEVMATTIPGFTPKSRLLGMSSGFGAPGWSFIGGIQPNIHRRAEQEDGDWLAKARDNEWITTNAFQNAPVLQTHAKNLDGRLSLEPFNDFKVDLDFSRNVSTNFSVFFKTLNKTGNTIEDLTRKTPREIGSFSMSYFSIPTLFDDDLTSLNQLFNKFEENRKIISEQRGLTDPHEKDGPEYKKGFGRKQQDVIVPAFIAAYTGKDPKNFEFTDMFDWIPRPNWTMSYNGLSKIPMFKDIFSNVRISHGYKNTLTVNSFESDLRYDDYDENTGAIIGQRNDGNLDTVKANYYSRFLMPSVVMEEQFAPLIGVDVKMKNDMNFSFNYSKRRGLVMGFTQYELAETRATTVDFGFDWKLKNVRLGFLPGFNAAARKLKASGEKPGDQKLGNDLSILFDISFSDNITLNHYLDQETPAKATRGSKDITISPSLSYDINKNVNLRFFVDYRRQQPYVSNSYLVINTEGGVTVRVKLE